VDVLDCTSTSVYADNADLRYMFWSFFVNALSMESDQALFYTLIESDTSKLSLAKPLVRLFHP
jgi:hypothetical protein